LFINNNFKSIKIHSSGIKYSPAIEKALKKDICNLIISPDSGNSEIYKRIKNTDAFDEVWNNIKKYSAAQNTLKNMVKIKYIILFGINDSKELIDEFFNKIIEANIKHVLIDADMAWYQDNKENKDKIEELFKKLKYMEDYAKKIGIEYGHNSVICCAIGKYHQLYDSTSAE
jgi:adenine C2-methylase RlmN of 23S rRNA A2503 and tRNA A37